MVVQRVSSVPYLRTILLDVSFELLTGEFVEVGRLAFNPEASRILDDDMDRSAGHCGGLTTGNVGGALLLVAALQRLERQGSSTATFGVAAASTCAARMSRLALGKRDLGPGLRTASGHLRLPSDRGSL